MAFVIGRKLLSVERSARPSVRFCRLGRMRGRASDLDRKSFGAEGSRSCLAEPVGSHVRRSRSTPPSGKRRLLCAGRKAAGGVFLRGYAAFPACPGLRWGGNAGSLPGCSAGIPHACPLRETKRRYEAPGRSREGRTVRRRSLCQRRSAVCTGGSAEKLCRPGYCALPVRQEEPL